MMRKETIEEEQLNAHPWDALDSKLAIGDKVKR
jgi:hypothetical protein